jgi:hypothetical protein
VWKFSEPHVTNMLFLGEHDILLHGVLNSYSVYRTIQSIHLNDVITL